MLAPLLFFYSFEEKTKYFADSSVSISKCCFVASVHLVLTKKQEKARLNVTKLVIRDIIKLSHISLHAFERGFFLLSPGFPKFYQESRFGR